MKVMVGTRRGPQRELLEALGAGRLEIDLDAEEYFAREDVAGYVRARLLAPDTKAPYGDDPALAEEVAHAVALRADRSFLVAAIVSASLAAEEEVVDVGRPGWDRQFPSELGDALDDYLARLPDERRIRDLLTALAFAEGKGFPFVAGHELWPLVATKLSGFSYEPSSVEALLRSRAADLIERLQDTKPTYRLFHQELRDHLRGRAPVRLGLSDQELQQRIVEALEATVPQLEQSDEQDWSRADRYVVAHLATHAAAAGRLDGFLDDPGYLVHADPSRLLHALPSATETAAVATRTYQQVAESLRTAPLSERPSYLELGARQVSAVELADEFARRFPARPWSAKWAHWRSTAGGFVAGRHRGAVYAVTTAELDGRSVIVSGGIDRAVRVWELADGRPVETAPMGHEGFVFSLTIAELDGRSVIVSGGFDGAVRVWELADGRPLETAPMGHAGWVRTVATAELEGRSVIVSGGLDGAVRVWELADGRPVETAPMGHAGWVFSLTTAELDGRSVIVSGGVDGGVRSWELGAAQIPSSRHAQAITIGSSVNEIAAVSSLLVFGSEAGLLCLAIPHAR